MKPARFLCHWQRFADFPDGPNRFFPHPRQGTRALPYKVLRYRARADRVVRPYKRFRRGRCLHRPVVPHPLKKSISLPGRRTE